MNRPSAREKDYFFQKTYFYFLKLNLRAKKQPKSVFSKFTPKNTYFFRFLVFKYFLLLNPKKNNAFSKKMSKFHFFFFFFNFFSSRILFFSIFSQKVTNLPIFVKFIDCYAKKKYRDLQNLKKK